MKRIAWRTLKIVSASLMGILLLLLLLPLLFPGAVSKKIKAWANNSITTELNFSRARLSFFNHFPSLTLTLHDFSLKGSAPFESDTLINAAEVSLGVDLSSIFSKTIRIDEIYLTKGHIHVLADADGRPNYNVFQAPATAKEPADSLGASLKIDRIQLEHCGIVYHDKSLGLLIRARDVNYLGKGDLQSAKFDLYSKIAISSLDLSYGEVPYIQSKKLHGDLITKINTQSLNFTFERNDLRINQLPVQLKGTFSFLRNGYQMDFNLSSGASTLEALFSALPADYISWMEHTDVKGAAEVTASLTGKYIARTNKMPDFTFNIKVRDGVIAHSGASSKLQHLRLDFQTKLPQMNTDKFYVGLDSLYFTLDKGYFSSSLNMTGLYRPDIHARMEADIDMQKWGEAMGWEQFDLKGHFTSHLKADGRYIQNSVNNGAGQESSIAISSIPAFDFNAALTDGYVKFDGVKESIHHIGFNVAANCPDNNYANIQVNVSRLNAEVLNNYIKGYLHLNNGQEPHVDASLKAIVHMADVEKFYPMDGIDLGGDLNINILSKGVYKPGAGQFPVTTASLHMHNGILQTKYYKHPIEKINVNAVLTDTAGSLQALKVDVKPVSFLFEGQEFTLKAALDNFENLRYNILASGTIDLGRIYKVLGKEGYDVQGMIKTDLSLQGTQADAMSGQYANLNNKGSLTVRGVTINAARFPLPFHIENGIFRFEEDKMWFDKFDLRYGQSNIHLNGHLYNLIAYATQKNQQLQGAFQMKSNYLLVDELKPSGSAEAAGVSEPPQVVSFPPNLSLSLTANADKVRFSGIDISRFHGQLLLNSGSLQLNKTGFSIIDAPVTMDAVYTPLSKQSAAFDYRINAKAFDIKRAYNEIRLFHDMATSAGSASGTVGLDYHVSGRLNEHMHPVYASLKGEGVLSLKKIKLKGFRMLNAVGNTTGRKDIKDPHLSEVDIRSSIANNIITIERTKLRIAGFRPRFEGQVSFDGRLNMKGRVGLPPFGILGIPFTVGGTQKNPVVKLRRGNAKDSLDREEAE
ncbi:AsmA family protein [Chitinophaga rhizophila]|uniref:AsmA family protein n=1 Tax=Chitinophaga rhizophila TaxID=2866212 RepID=A0ABS7GIQ9_9BACT|nr:AsmA family protein [Chitinophaga rhizophila]MBW8687120.1 AsmA family protein [Chitinophaga rhizophila]